MPILRLFPGGTNFLSNPRRQHKSIQRGVLPPRILAASVRLKIKGERPLPSETGTELASPRSPCRSFLRWAGLMVPSVFKTASRTSMVLLCMVSSALRRFSLTLQATKHGSLKASMGQKAELFNGAKSGILVATTSKSKVKPTKRTRGYTPDVAGFLPDVANRVLHFRWRLSLDWPNSAETAILIKLRSNRLKFYATLTAGESCRGPPCPNMGGQKARSYLT